jgi:hypothetical protein
LALSLLKPMPSTMSTVWSGRASATAFAFWLSWPRASLTSGPSVVAPRTSTTSILSPLGSLAILPMLKPRFFSSSPIRAALPARAPPL